MPGSARPGSCESCGSGSGPHPRAVAADGTVPLLRPGHHLLAVGGGAEGALRDPRERFGGRRRARARRPTVPRPDARPQSPERASTRWPHASGCTTHGSSSWQSSSRERPTVLLVEDIHWAEDDLCDLLETLVGRGQGPLLLLTTARPELLDRRPAWGRARRNASQLRARGASAGRGGAAPRRAARGRAAGRPCAELIVERAEGNPFFVEELIATLIDTGVLERTNGGWSFGELPPGLRGAGLGSGRARRAHRPPSAAPRSRRCKRPR